MTEDDVMLTRQEAAQYLRMSVGFLESLARRKEGPVFFKLSSRRTAYRQSDLQAWLNSVQVRPQA